MDVVCCCRVFAIVSTNRKNAAVFYRRRASLLFVLATKTGRLRSASRCIDGFDPIHSLTHTCRDSISISIQAASDVQTGSRTRWAVFFRNPSKSIFNRRCSVPIVRALWSTTIIMVECNFLRQSSFSLSFWVSP